MIFLFSLYCVPGSARPKSNYPPQNPNHYPNPVIMSHYSRAICLRFSIIPTFLLFCLFAAAQKKPEVPVDHRFDPLDQLFKQDQKELGQFVAMVWKDGKLLYQKQSSDDFTPKTG